MKFKRVDMNQATGTSLVGYFRATYKELFYLLGHPDDGDDYKVSTEWVVDWMGEVFTIYDWKSSSLYDPSYPSRKEIREDDNPRLWHVGGFKDCEYFIQELHWTIDKNEKAYKFLVRETKE